VTKGEEINVIKKELTIIINTRILTYLFIFKLLLLTKSRKRNKSKLRKYIYLTISLTWFLKFSLIDLINTSIDLIKKKFNISYIILEITSLRKI